MNSSNPSSLEDYAKNIMGISISINLVVGLPSNGYVLWLIVSGAGGTMALEFFALNLAVSEILFCSSNVLHLVNIYVPSLGLYSFVAFSSGLLTLGRSLFQTFICLERYLAVVHPVVFLRYKPLRYKLGCCVVLWAVIIPFCCISMLCGKNTRLLFWMYVTEDLFFLSINLFFGLSVLRALKRPKPGEGGVEQERHRGSDIKMKAFKIILFILVSMMIYYLPWIVLIIASELSKDIVLADIGIVCFSITVVTGFVQPLLYLHRTGRLPCIKSF